MKIKNDVHSFPEFYFKNPDQWRKWLHENHNSAPGVYLIFYKVAHEKDSMRWEEAVKVALCYGWIDSTVKSLGNGKRRQYFCPRKAKSTWSKLNKRYIEELNEEGLMHTSGMEKVQQAKQDGSWAALDEVENGIIPKELRQAFNANEKAYKNYCNFSFTHQKSYLYWLNQAKRQATREARIKEIIRLCSLNIKSRQ